MPKRSKSKKDADGKTVERISGCTFLQSASSLTATNFVIQPSDSAWGARLNQLADCFNLYRFTKLHLYWQSTSNLTTSMSVVLGTTDTFPTTTLQVLQCEKNQINWFDQSIPSKLLLNRDYLLKGPIPWYKAVGGTPTTDFETQGNIFMASSSATTFAVRVEYEIEFADWVPISSTPKPKDVYEQIPGTQLYKLVSAASAELKASNLSPSLKRDGASSEVVTLVS